jgi:hypothetical protein
LGPLILVAAGLDDAGGDLEASQLVARLDQKLVTMSKE